MSVEAEVVPQPAQPKERETFYVYVGPTRVRVRKVGSGTPLLLIMGIGGNLKMWEPLEHALPDRELIMFDFPGTGGSGISFMAPTMPHNAMFIKLLIQRLGYRRVDVLGYSWGGALAQQLAIQHPNTVRHLVLASTTVGVGGLPPSPRVMARMITPRRYYSATYFNRIAPTLYGGRYRTDPSLLSVEMGRRVGRPPSLLGYASQLAAIMSYSSIPGLPVISAPTLILAGDDDPILPKWNARLIKRLIRHSRLVVVPGAGHLLLFDSTDTVAPYIREFLNSDRT